MVSVEKSSVSFEYDLSRCIRTWEEHGANWSSLKRFPTGAAFHHSSPQENLHVKTSKDVRGWKSMQHVSLVCCGGYQIPALRGSGGGAAAYRHVPSASLYNTASCRRLAFQIIPKCLKLMSRLDTVHRQLGTGMF
jgi:hypothetical protein